ncbi:hypothetical protein [Tenacibaculum finnmarkense]|uniref:Uncharacterized protein n=1 Tax=Tenacibaculum finnmarkense genomovar finnmarkense TaxID=1458503 RepID=A0AAP1RDD2_9FLAO|nr:hypothetical protein [Tenacibaculum finnmarkense]MBE7693994.1 hypothetical protein [Tenacibaculum finnmarkense genomovar finnmarkense]MCD8426506.1 hypothetical protein [Tenacibaculum finnmarkense genomovar finnmarkense]MCG8774351.1 hypothetical protein [Tenacibaculum finnmarkense]MCG8871386.1 hypothetical protein [Tenacibaculum finnmarkense]SOS49919.1 conserved hypothetical protein [Tenacibaculum finnmarkense]
MKYFKKFYLVIYPLLIVFFIFMLDKIFLIQESWIRIGVAIALAYILSPRKKIIRTQSGDRKQLTWIFLKNPIFLE